MELNSVAGLVDARPPRLEDAGLEDCALPGQAIQEAFKRAADALQNAHRHVQSAATGVFGTVGDENFAKNPGPSNGSLEDSFVNPKESAVLGEEQSCVDVKAGGLIEEGHDLVVVQGDGNSEGDKVVFGHERGPKLGDKGCVEGLVDDKNETKDLTDGSEDGPILVLA